MDKIKAIKIRNADGTYTDEIPISIDASYVNTTSGEDAQSTLDSLSENINSLKDSIDSNTSNITINTNSINTLTTQVSSQEEQVNDLSTNLDSLKVNIEELTNEESTGRVDILEINQDDLTNRITTLEDGSGTSIEIEDGSITAEKLSVEKLSDITPILGIIDSSDSSTCYFQGSSSSYYFYPLVDGNSPSWVGRYSKLSNGGLYLGRSSSTQGYIQLLNSVNSHTSSISSSGIELTANTSSAGSSKSHVSLTPDSIHLWNSSGYQSYLTSGSSPEVYAKGSSTYFNITPTAILIGGGNVFEATDNSLYWNSGAFSVTTSSLYYLNGLFNVASTGTMTFGGTTATMSSLTSLDIGSSVTTSGSPTITIGDTESGTPTVYIGKTVEVSSGSMKVNQGGLTVNGSLFQVADTVSAAPIYASNIWLGNSTSSVTCSGNSFLCNATTTTFNNDVVFNGSVSLMITDDNIVDNSISGEKIADNTITYAKMADGFADSLLTDETYVSNTESIIANTSTLTADDPIVENLSALISVSGGLSYTIVDSTDSIDLTVANADSYVYMVPNANGVDGNLYDEYMVINGAIEKVGDWSIDLNDYATKTYVDNAIDGYITTSSISATTTGTGNVITSASYDSTTGTTIYNKDITALTESDIEEYTADEINALYALIA